MNNYRLRGVQSHITNPDVLAAVISSSDYAITGKLSVQPSQAEHIIKQGKSPAAEAIAPVVTDEKLLTKLSRDARKGVRAAVLQNPHLTQDHLVNILKRAIKNDADFEVAAPAAAKMEDDVLLESLQEHVIERVTSYNYATLKVGGLDGSVGSNGYHGRATQLIEELCRRLPEGGLEYLKKLHAIGYEEYFLFVRGSTTHYYGAGSDWYKPGMLSWMAPEMKDEHVAYFLANILECGAEISVEDAKVAAEIIKDLELPALENSTRSRYLRIRLDEETLRTLYDMGGYWRRILQKAAGLPEDIQLKFVSELSDAELFDYAAPNPDSTYAEWEPGEVKEDNGGPDECYNWQSPDAINMIGDRWADMILNYQFDIHSSRYNLPTAAATMLHFVQSVHPDRRRALSPEVLMLTSWAGMRYYSGRKHLGIEPLTEWAKGKLDDKPTPERVQKLMRMANIVAGGSNAMYSRARVEFLNAITPARRVSLLLGETLEMAGQEALMNTEAVYLVFQHYLGDDAEAWTVALDLGSDWEGDLEELAITAAAATGLDIPEEVVDLADIEAAEAVESEETSEETEDAQPAEDQTNEDATDADSDTPEEPTSEETTSEEDDTTEESEDETEDIESLDITTPVMYTLF